MNIDTQLYKQIGSLDYTCPKCDNPTLEIQRHKTESSELVRCSKCFTWFNMTGDGLVSVFRENFDPRKQQADSGFDEDIEYLQYVDSLQTIGEEPLSKNKWKEKYLKEKTRRKKTDEIF